jgi:penicillin amidase
MKDYVAPTQNGLVADRAGSIGIRSAGWYPVRPGDGRGDRIFDGSTRASDWLGMLPIEQYPHAFEPAQGYLASANQQPVDPRDNPAYLGANWYAPWRALHINAMLRADSQVTPEAMRRFQTDPGSARADAFAPLFLEAARNLESAGKSDDRLRRAAELLAQWQRRYLPDDQRAILFELAMQGTVRRLFDELIPPGATGDSARPVVFPDGAVVLELFHDPTNPWWDDRRTAGRVESRDDILGASLRAALDTATARYGEPDGGGWAWGKVRTAKIYHLLRLPSLSALQLPVRSGPSTLAPLDDSGVHGASWRMVVELGPEVHAWATYPGGQSGNPASPFYMDRVPKWVRGELDPVLFPHNASDLPPDRVLTRYAFVPGN